MSSIFKSHSFYVKIVTAFIGLLILTVLPIVSYNFYKNSNMALGWSDDLMSQITRTVMEKTGNYFLPAEVLVAISARLSEMGALCCDDSTQVELFTMGVLQSYPQVCMFFLGDEKGNYIRTWRLPDGNMETRIINCNVTPHTNTYKYWDRNFKVFKTETSTQVDYDPRVRPWYVGAKKARGSYWTKAYILARNKQPAVTTAFPVINKAGQIVGVWGADIELEQISTFLKSLKIGKNGQALIINDQHEVVAYPDLSRLVKEENGTLRPLRLEELGLQPLSRALTEYRRTGRSKSIIESRGQKYLTSFAAFPASFPARWQVALVVPEEDFIGAAKQLTRETLLICLVILLLAMLMAVFLARSMSKPIKLLAAEAQKIRNFHLDDKIAITSYIKEIQLMGNAIAAMKTGLQAFRRYVPAELVRQLINTGEEARLGGQKRNLTVFFSDISGFTSITERLSPEELMLNLSEYFDDLTKILSAEKATVDKYIGDGILAFWGAPLPDEDHARHACQAALRCQERIAELNRTWVSAGKFPFETRIGISTGETIVGNVGSSERINYTVMGDTVNLASRLEGVNKIYGTKIIVDRATHEAVAADFWLRPLGVVAVKGKSEGVMIYELLGRRLVEAEDSETAALCAEFGWGFAAYMKQEWDQAAAIFTELAHKFPRDKPTHLYLSRCRHYQEQPPGPDWQGVEHLEVK